MEMIISELKDLEKVVDYLLSHDFKTRIWLFSGEIGAGKTTLIQQICKRLGVDENISSPTFSIVNQYIFSNSDKEKCQIYHMDLYRLNKLEEAYEIGIEEYLYDDAWCFIEWPDIIEPILPETVLKINIELLGDSSRKFIFL